MDAHHHALPEMSIIGVLYQDLDQQSDQALACHLQDMTTRDRAHLRSMLSWPILSAHPRIHRELRLLRDSGVKAELQALHASRHAGGPASLMTDWLLRALQRSMVDTSCSASSIPTHC